MPKSMVAVAFLVLLVASYLGPAVIMFSNHSDPTGSTFDRILRQLQQSHENSARTSISIGVGGTFRVFKSPSFGVEQAVDVAVTQLTVNPPGSATLDPNTGWAQVIITAMLQNNGQSTVSADVYVTVEDTGRLISKQTFNLPPGTTSKDFAWVADKSDVGSHTIQVAVSVSGDSNPGNNSQSVPYQIQGAAQPPQQSFDFSISVSPSSGSVDAGKALTPAGTVVLTLLGGSSQSVSLTLSGLMSSVGADDLSGKSCTPNCQITFGIGTFSATPPGTYILAITGVGGGMTHSVTFQLSVNAPQPPAQAFDFGISVWPGSATVDAGKALTPAGSVTLTVTSGTSTSVALSLSGLPSTVGVDDLNGKSCTPNCLIDFGIGTFSGASPGTYTLTITGSGGGRSHSTSFQLIVNSGPPLQNFEFSISVSPASASVDPGKALTPAGTVAVEAISGSPQSVSLSLSGLPPNVGVDDLSGKSCVPTCQIGFGIGTFTGAPSGPYQLTISGAGGGKTHSITFTLTINQPPPTGFDFSISVSPSSGSVDSGKALTPAGTVTLTLLSSSPQPVALSISGLPSSVGTDDLTGKSCTPTCQLDFGIGTYSGASPGTYTLTITGNGGGQTHYGTFTLTVNEVPPANQCSNSGGDLYSLPACAIGPDGKLVGRALLTSVSGKQTVTAQPGETLTFSVSYQIWQGNNPHEIDQLMFIPSWTPSWPPPSGYYYGIYSHVPTSSPGDSGSQSFSLTAPSTSGTYYLWFVFDANYGYDQASADFRTQISGEAHIKIIVQPEVQTLIASISAQPTSGEAPLRVSFASTVTGGRSPYKYLWDFGDQSSDNSQNPTHSYAVQGTYYARLQVSDSLGAAATSNTVEIQVGQRSNQVGHLVIVSVDYPGTLGSVEMGETVPLKVQLGNAGQGVIPAGTNYYLTFDLVDYKGKGASVWQALDTYAAWKYGSDILQEVKTKVTIDRNLNFRDIASFQYSLQLSDDWSGDPVIFTNTLQVQAVRVDGTDVSSSYRLDFRVWPTTDDTVNSLITLVALEVPKAFGFQTVGDMEVHAPGVLESLIVQLIVVTHDLVQKDWNKTGKDMAELVLKVCGFFSCDPVAVVVNLAKSIWVAGRTIAYAIVIVAGFIVAAADKLGVSVCRLWVFETTICVSAGSDVKLLVTSPNGSRIGGGLQSGQWNSYQEVQNAWYSGLDSSPQYVVIPSPETGTYGIAVTGHSNGSYRLNTTLTSDGGVASAQTVMGQVDMGATQQHNVLVLSNENRAIVDPPTFTVVWYTQRPLIIGALFVPIILACVLLYETRLKAMLTTRRKRGRVGGVCPKCGFGNRQGTLFCTRDGVRLIPTELPWSELPSRDSNVCPKCGVKNRPNARFCVRDRTPLRPTITRRELPMTSRMQPRINVVCTKCGIRNRLAALYCKHCRAILR